MCPRSLAMPVLLEGSVSSANLLSTSRSTNGKQIFFTQDKHLISVTSAEVRPRGKFISFAFVLVTFFMQPPVISGLYSGVFPNQYRPARETVCIQAKVEQVSVRKEDFTIWKVT